MFQHLHMKNPVHRADVIAAITSRVAATAMIFREMATMKSPAVAATAMIFHEMATMKSPAVAATAMIFREMATMKSPAVAATPAPTAAIISIPREIVTVKECRVEPIGAPRRVLAEENRLRGHGVPVKMDSAATSPRVPGDKASSHRMVQPHDMRC